MRIVDILVMTRHDFRRSLKPYIICVVIISLLFGVAIMLFDIRSVMLNIIRTQFPDENKFATVEFVDADSDLTGIITKIGFRDVVLDLAYGYMLQNGLTFSNGSQNLDLDKYEFADVYNKTALAELCGDVTYSVSEELDMPQASAIMSETILKKIGLSVGAKICINDEEMSNDLEVLVVGSFSEKMEGGNALVSSCDMIVNNAVGHDLLESRGISTEYVGTAVIEDIFDFPEYTAKLNKLGIHYYGISYEEIARVNAEIKQLMIIISGVLALAGFFIIIIYITQTIIKYAANFGIRLALGMKYKTITFEFILTIEVLLIAGIVFSKLVSMMLYIMVQNKISDVLEIVILTPSVFSLGALVLFIVANMLIVLSAVFIRNRIININTTKFDME